MYISLVTIVLADPVFVSTVSISFSRQTGLGVVLLYMMQAQLKPVKSLNIVSEHRDSLTL